MSKKNTALVSQRLEKISSGCCNKIIIHVVILTILLLTSSNNALALSNDFFSKTYALKINEGFGPLSWGMHPNKAFETYPDLIEFNSNSYNKYIKGKGSDGIHLWMVRNNEDVLFAGIKMDVIKYQFIDNCLFSITAEKRCSADETLCNGENLYKDFVEFARNTFGRPYEIGSTISKTK